MLSATVQAPPGTASTAAVSMRLDLSEPNVYRIYYLSKTDEKWYTMAEGASSVTPGDGATGVVMLDESYNYALENGVLLLSNAKTSFSLKATAGIVTQGKPKME